MDMRKILCLVLVLCLTILCIAGCRKDKEKSKSQKDTEVTETSVNENDQRPESSPGQSIQEGIGENTPDEPDNGLLVEEEDESFGADIDVGDEEELTDGD